MATLLVHSVSFACYPAMISLLSPVHPQLSPLHKNTALTAAPMIPRRVCPHSVISLLTVGMLSVFVSPFSFFMHSTTLRRSSASPANSSMFCPHTLALLSFCIFTLPSHLHSHAVSVLDLFWLLWAKIMLSWDDLLFCLILISQRHHHFQTVVECNIYLSMSCQFIPLFYQSSAKNIHFSLQ